MTPNKINYWSDSRNWAKTGTGIVLAGGLGLIFLVYVLPILVTIVWTGISLIIGGSILAVLMYALLSKGTYRRLGYLTAKIAKMMTFWIIEWDEFLIQEMAINKAKKDREVIREQSENLLGQVSQKDDELSEANTKMTEAKGMVSELISQGRTPDDPELLLAANELGRQQEFISTITPLRNQIQELGLICQKVYADTGMKIKDAEAELDLQKVRLRSLTAGETAMNKAMSIFTGENPDVKLAEELVKQKIGAKIGSIRNTLNIITPIMNERALRDKVKLKSTLLQLKESTTEYKAPIPISNYNTLLNN